MTDHPIAPPSELVHQWHREACRDPYTNSAFFMSRTLKYIAAKAASWGWLQRDASVADELQKAREEELQACCEWVRATHFIDLDGHEALRAARRPKLKSRKQQALDALAQMEDQYLSAELAAEIRNALEELPDD